MYLITHATVINWSPRYLQADHAVLVQDGLITAIGPTVQMIERYPSAQQYDAKHALLMPGNICAHTHFYGAFSRGLAIPGKPPRNFPEILSRLWWNLDTALTLPDVKLSTQVCLLDAVKHGTTTLFDHHASPNAIDGSLDMIADAVEEAGLRAVLCYEVSDRDGDQKRDAGIAENIRFLKAASGRKNIAATFGLHASLTLSDETLKACANANENFGSFHIHVAEHEADEDDSLARSGVRVVQRLNHKRILGPLSIAAHAVHVDPWELEILRETATWVTHQPRSNMNNAVGVAPFDHMMRGGIKLCLGNDGFSNDMFAEWKAAYLLHKVASRDPRQANGETIAKIAGEYNSALVETFFMREDFSGVEEGAVADLILVDYKPFTPLTGNNLPWHVLFGFESSMVKATIVSGRMLMWDRQLLTMDEEKILAEARQASKGVWERFGKV
jgi:putative selenium metabolism protein SsnA